MTGGARPGDPTDWPDHLPELREIDKLLRCPICFEYINTAMLLPCSHNYCSLCIRRYIGFRTQCPTCIESVTEPQIKNNRLVDEVISKFSAVRSKLLQIVRGEKVEITQKSAENESEVTVRQSSRPKKRQPIIDDTDFDVEITGCDISVNEETKPLTGSALDISIHTPSKAFGGLKNSFLSPPPPECSTPKGLNSVMSPGFLSPSASTQSPGVSTSQSPGGSTNTTPGGSSNVKKVPCPVCCVEVSERTINLHLDRCLAGDQKKEALRSTKPVRRKPMPKLVYNLLKDKDLKKKLIEVGLPTDGDRQAMIKRHHEFTLRYNAECDSLQPKSAQEIMQDMQRSDRTKCSASLPSVKPEHRLVIEKGAGSAEVETAQKSYVKQHRSQFAQLIAETRKRQQKLKQASSLASESQSSESRTETITSSSSMDVPLESTLGFSRVIPENTSDSLSSSPHTLPSREFNNVFVQPSRTDCVIIDAGSVQNPNSPPSGKHSPNDHSENEDWENPAGISTVTSPCIKNFFSPTKSKDGHKLDSQTSEQIVSNVAKNLCHEFKQNHEDSIAPTSQNSATNNYNENTRNQGASNVKIRTDSSSRGVDTDREPMPSQKRQTSFHDVSWNEEDDKLLEELTSEDGVHLPKCEEKDSNSTEACNSKPNQTIPASSDEEDEKETVSRFIPTIRNYASDSSDEDESEAVAEAGQQGDFSGNFEEDWTHELESSPPDEDELKSPSLFSDSQPVACSGTSGASALPYKGVTPTSHAKRGIIPPDLPCSGESTLGYEDMACGQNQTPEQLNGDLAEGNHIPNSDFTSPESPVIQSGRGSKRKRGTTPPPAPQQDKKPKGTTPPPAPQQDKKPRGRPLKRDPLPVADLPQDILNELEEYRQETRRTTRSRAKKL